MRQGATLTPTMIAAASTATIGEMIVMIEGAATTTVATEMMTEVGSVTETGERVGDGVVALRISHRPEGLARSQEEHLRCQA